MVKNLCAKAGDAKDAGVIPGSERSHEAGNGNPLQYSCLETSMDRGSWQAAVHGVAESDRTKHACVNAKVKLDNICKCTQNSA